MTTKTYDEALAFTQGIREEVIHKLIEPGIPTDKDSLDMLLRTAKDMDHTTIANRRNQIESEGAKDTKVFLQGMAELIRTQKNRNPFAVAETDRGPAEVVAPTITPGELGDFEHADGIDQIGIIVETSDEFNRRMSGELVPVTNP